MLQIQLLSSMTLAAIVLLLLPFVPTVVVGIERQRTVTSVGLLCSPTSAYGFSSVLGAEVTLDPSPIGAEVMSGIDFLGMRVIFVQQNVVSGLTTASSIWVTARSE